MLQRTLAALSIAAALSLLLVATASAHVVRNVGPYHVEIGWQHEPSYIGEANGVQVIVHDANDKPVNDLKEGDLKVVVSTANQQSPEVTFQPAFDLEEGEGSFGEYDAPIIPTVTGDYTFHVTGTIRERAIDISVTSGEQTFDSVRGTSDIEFPAKLPSLPEIVTRLDRIDARLAQPAGGPTQASVDAAVASASDARAAADRALLLGAGLGLAGLVIAVLALAVAYRATRPETRTR